MKKKKYIILAIILLVIILLVIGIIYPNKQLTEEILTYKGNFIYNNKQETLTVKIIKWYEKPPKNMAADDGWHTKTTFFLEDQEIFYTIIDYDNIEIIDYDNDGIDEIKTTLTYEPPASGTWCTLYKISNNKLEEVDSYEVQHFFYNIHTKSFEEIHIESCDEYYALAHSYHNQYTVALDKLIEIQFREKNCAILYNNQNYTFDLIREYGTNNDIIKYLDLDNDGIKELLIGNMILKIVNDVVTIYKDTEVLNNLDNIDFNIFNASIDLNYDGIIDNCKIEQAIKTNENNERHVIYTNIYINNVMHKVWTTKKFDEILSIEAMTTKYEDYILVNSSTKKTRIWIDANGKLEIGL